MGDPPLTYERATVALTGPGGYFELATEEVIGEPMQVFANRPRSLRDLLVVEGMDRGREGVIDRGGGPARVTRHVTFLQDLSPPGVVRQGYPVAETLS